MSSDVYVSVPGQSILLASQLVVCDRNGKLVGAAVGLGVRGIPPHGMHWDGNRVVVRSDKRGDYHEMRIDPVSGASEVAVGWTLIGDGAGGKIDGDGLLMAANGRQVSIPRSSIEMSTAGRWVIGDVWNCPFILDATTGRILSPAPGIIPGPAERLHRLDDGTLVIDTLFGIAAATPGEDFVRWLLPRNHAMGGGDSAVAGNHVLMGMGMEGHLRIANIGRPGHLDMASIEGVVPAWRPLLSPSGGVKYWW